MAIPAGPSHPPRSIPTCRACGRQELLTKRVRQAALVSLIKHRAQALCCELCSAPLRCAGARRAFRGGEDEGVARDAGKRQLFVQRICRWVLHQVEPRTGIVIGIATEISAIADCGIGDAISLFP
eukprot:6320898-Prymnesium_polylepis.1